ncbi:hypothetical protein LCGC14_1821750 [marine sediment metagenome]|uniref:Uncharacterized protein n=1 Tax=marine sediment metagenome TaxID=412755 RepID=A0A0F9IYG8_9ZZZZ
MVSQASRNIEDIIMLERRKYMTQMYAGETLHKTIKSWIDEINPETDTSKLTAMIIAEVKNG